MGGDVLGRELAGVTWEVLMVRLGEGRAVGVPVAPKTTMSYCRLCFGAAIVVVVSLVDVEMMQTVRNQW